MSEKDHFGVLEIICHKLCIGCECWHRCWNTKSDLEYKGINLKKVTGVYDMKKQMFPCDNCKYKGNTMENVLIHFETKNQGGYHIKCWFCGKEIETMDEFKKHIGTYHYTEQYQGDDD